MHYRREPQRLLLEKRELKKAMAQRRGEIQAKMLKRFDSDKDGSLSPEEKKAAFNELNFRARIIRLLQTEISELKVKLDIYNPKTLLDHVN